MAIIQFEDGTKVNFDGNPTPADVEEVYKKISLTKAKPIQASSTQQSQTYSTRDSADTAALHLLGNVTGVEKLGTAAGYALNNIFNKPTEELTKISNADTENRLKLAKMLRDPNTSDAQKEHIKQFFIQNPNVGIDEKALNDITTGGVTNKQVLSSALQTALFLGSFGLGAPTAATKLGRIAQVAGTAGALGATEGAVNAYGDTQSPGYGITGQEAKKIAGNAALSGGISALTAGTIQGGVEALPTISKTVNRLLSKTTGNSEELLNVINERPVNTAETAIDRHIQSAQQVLDNTTPANLEKVGGLSEFIDQTKKNIVDGLSAQGDYSVAKEINKLKAENFSSLSEFSDAVKNVQTKATAQSALTDTQGVVRKLRNTLTNDWQTAADSIATEFQNKNVSLPESTLKLLKKVEDVTGGLDSVPSDLSQISATDLINLQKEVNGLSSKTAYKISPEGVPVRKLADELKQVGIDAFGGPEGSYANLYRNYSAKKQVFDAANDIVKAYSTGKPITQATAARRLQNIFDEDKVSYLQAIKELEASTGQNVLQKIAQTRTAKVLPKLKFHSDIWTNTLKILALPLTSPKISAFLSKTGNAISQKGPSIANRVAPVVENVVVPKLSSQVPSTKSKKPLKE